MTNQLGSLAHAKDTLLEELRRHGIGIPYPHREVRLIGGSG